MPERKGKIKQATIKDVAKLANTSIATVSYVFSDSKTRYITDEMRQKVEDAAKELGYVKNSLASGLKGKERGIIAVLTPQFENHFFVSTFSAIERIANQNGYVLSTCNTSDDPDKEKDIIERMMRLRVDGYLIIPTHKGAENTEKIRAYGAPYVSIERPLDGVEGYDFISSDNFHASYSLTAHMIEKGHKRLALVYWDSQISNLRERLDGYKQALADNGLDFDEALVKYCDNITHEKGASATSEVLSDYSVTAIVYGQYILAEGGIKLLRQNKVEIPNRISVALVGQPKWIEMTEMKFTHIEQPSETIGEEAAEILFKKLLTGQQQAAERIHRIIPGVLHIGDTVKDIND